MSTFVRDDIDLNNKEKKSLTEKFPFLLPLRKFQRKLFFYTGMKFDGNIYAKEYEDDYYQNEVFSYSQNMYNEDTGFNMVYQENKIHNLKLAAKKLDGLIIKPGETFSLWLSIRDADKEVGYKDGLVVKNGKLTTSNGGGLCQISNLLFYVFLHSPLKIVERHSHRIKDFPDPSGDILKGVDATIAEGWLDLKVLNLSNNSFQIKIDFDDSKIYVSLLSLKELNYSYEILNENLRYENVDGDFYEKVDIYRLKKNREEKIIQKKLLYRNRIKIGYDLESYEGEKNE